MEGAEQAQALGARPASPRMAWVCLFLQAQSQGPPVVVGLDFIIVIKAVTDWAAKWAAMWLKVLSFPFLR